MSSPSRRRRRRQAEPASGPVVGVTWYTKEQWARVKAAATDPERFEPTFEQWSAMAEEAFAEWVATGIEARRFHIDAAQLSAWCLTHGKPNNAAARAEFVTEQLNVKNSARP